MIRPTQCLVLVCDGCAAVLSHPDTEAEIHYDTAEQARTDATEDLQWSQAGGRDLCPACTCAEQGHDWPDWWTPPARGAAAPQLPPCRWCDRCHALDVQGEGVIRGA